MRAIIVRKKFWGLQMLTWVWLARAKHELTKPKSTFRPQNFLSGLRAPHVQSFPFPTVASPDSGQWAHSGQLSPGGSRQGWGPVTGGTGRVGRCRRIMQRVKGPFKLYRGPLSQTGGPIDLLRGLNDLILHFH